MGALDFPSVVRTTTTTVQLGVDVAGVDGGTRHHWGRGDVHRVTLDITGSPTREVRLSKARCHHPPVDRGITIIVVVYRQPPPTRQRDTEKQQRDGLVKPAGVPQTN